MIICVHSLSLFYLSITDSKGPLMLIYFVSYWERSIIEDLWNSFHVNDMTGGRQQEPCSARRTTLRTMRRRWGDCVCLTWKGRGRGGWRVALVGFLISPPVNCPRYSSPNSRYLLRLLASCSLYPLATLRALLTFLFLSRSSAERLDSGQGLLCGDWRLENTFSDNLICYWRDGGIEGEVGRGGRRHPLLLEENDNNKTRFMDIEEPLIARRPSSTSSSSRRRKRGCTQK